MNPFLNWLFARGAETGTRIALGTLLVSIAWVIQNNGSLKDILVIIIMCLYHMVMPEGASLGPLSAAVGTLKIPELPSPVPVPLPAAQAAPQELAPASAEAGFVRPGLLVWLMGGALSLIAVLSLVGCSSDPAQTQARIERDKIIATEAECIAALGAQLSGPILDASGNPSGVAVSRAGDAAARLCAALRAKNLPAN
jgi:hypothetical protein